MLHGATWGKRTLDLMLTWSSVILLHGATYVFRTHRPYAHQPARHLSTILTLGLSSSIISINLLLIRTYPLCFELSFSPSSVAWSTGFSKISGLRKSLYIRPIRFTGFDIIQLSEEHSQTSHRDNHNPRRRTIKTWEYIVEFLFACSYLTMVIIICTHGGMDQVVQEYRIECLTVYH